MPIEKSLTRSLTARGTDVFAAQKEMP